MYHSLGVSVSLSLSLSLSSIAAFTLTIRTNMRPARLNSRAETIKPQCRENRQKQCRKRFKSLTVNRIT